MISDVQDLAEEQIREETQNSYFEEKHEREELRNDEDYTDAKYEMV